tara:strand:+ start:1082 stop:1396 length:315 start_codon:yes stop_codon:yes gene_type:complete
MAESMKEAITVTIDADIHTWIKQNSKKKSQFVNNILRGAKDKWISQKRIDIPKISFWCYACKTASPQTPSVRGFRQIGYCLNKECTNYGVEIPLMEKIVNEMEM